MWTEYFKNIKLINLPHRTDRLEASAKVLNDYGIPFKVVEAIYNKQEPCVGLVDTMKSIFFDAQVERDENVLIFEDDIKPLVAPEFFHATMDCIVKDLPSNWDVLFLGCNPAGGFEHWVGNSLLRLRFGYNTHAVAYNKRTIDFIMSKHIHEPIDNFMVREFQKNATVLAAFPLLFSQIPGFSDIGGQHTDWTKEIDERYSEQVKLVK